jgi:hypothetical protein
MSAIAKSGWNVTPENQIPTVLVAQSGRGSRLAPHGVG